MISIRRYSKEDSKLWNEFNKDSKNGLFMFDRNYMDYHEDRFQDHSLMFFDEEKLLAIIPMCEHGNELISHGGLTYGGFVTDSKMKQHTMNECFNVLIKYAKEKGCCRIRYKCVPYIYHTQASEEDRFSLFANDAKLVTVDVSTYLNLRNPLKMPKGRKAQISRACREGVEIRELTELNDYRSFIKIENEVLSKRHNTKAVHTGDELKLLHDRFPNEIKLIGAIKDGNLIAGTVIYIYKYVVHTQYMAANEEARVIGALDLAIHSVIDTYKDNKYWLDFGISTEHGRVYLNEGLCSQKEGFGGRTGVYEIWELNI